MLDFATAITTLVAGDDILVHYGDTTHDYYHEGQVAAIDAGEPRMDVTIAGTTVSFHNTDPYSYEKKIPAITGIRAFKISQLNDYRKAAVMNFSFMGMPLLLDGDTENALSKAIQGLTRAPIGSTVDWEIMPGYFQTFDLATVSAIGDAAFAHVQACFTNVKNKVLAINAATTVEDVMAIDLTSGWPNGLPSN